MAEEVRTMQDHRSSAWDSPLTSQSPPRVAVVGGGIAGLTCAREAGGLPLRSRRSGSNAVDQDLGQQLEAYL